MYSLQYILGGIYGLIENLIGHIGGSDLASGAAPFPSVYAVNLHLTSFMTYHVEN